MLKEELAQVPREATEKGVTKLVLQKPYVMLRAVGQGQELEGDGHHQRVDMQLMTGEAQEQGTLVDLQHKEAGEEQGQLGVAKTSKYI